MEKQYLCEQIRKAMGQLEDRQELPAAADGPPRQWMQNYRSGIMQDQFQALEKKGRNKDNTPPI